MKSRAWVVNHRSQKCLGPALWLGLLLARPLPACELCAIYSASNARGEASEGFLFTMAEQFTSYGNLQFEGEEYRPTNIPYPLAAAYLDNFITHFVPGYNFSPRVGLSVNVPLIHNDFRRVQITLPPPFGQGVVDERGSETGLGDVALIGRFAVLQKVEMGWSAIVNLLGGIKFPTGSTDRLQEEVAEARIHRNLFPQQADHIAIGGIHQHDLTLGSGSYDGVFGAAANFRWDRWLLNFQGQYYLRTEAGSYKFGDLIVASGGPGAYLLLGKSCTLSLFANAFYESSAQDELFGLPTPRTGMTAWYLGPQLYLTLGEHFSANAGVDIPLRIYNHGLQTVPDSRVRAGFTWRF